MGYILKAGTMQVRNGDEMTNINMFVGGGNQLSSEDYLKMVMDEELVDPFIDGGKILTSKDGEIYVV